MRSPQFVPPRLPMRFFRAICKADFLEEIEGDLLEIYEQKAQENSPSKLRWLFIWEITRLIRPKLLKSVIPSSVNPFFMFQDHFKVSYRNLRRQKGYTLINLLGLSLGIASAILLFLVVSYEKSFDGFHPNSARIYKIGEMENGGEPDYLTKTPLAPKLKADLPEVVAATRFAGWDSPWLEAEHGRIQETIKFVDEDFADMFGFAVLEGDLKQTLATKGQMVITEKKARELFGDDRAVGKQVKEVLGDKTWIVGAVLQDIPTHSTIQFSILSGWSNIPDYLADPELANWYNTFMTAYVMLDEYATPQQLADKLDQIVADNFLPAGNAASIHLLPLKSSRAVEANNDMVINLLGIVAIIILAIASVNYVNLASAQALVRIKEVTIRKVLGSSKRQLVSQFLAEAFIVNFLATLAAWLMLFFAIPYMEEIFSIAFTYTSGGWAVMVGATLFFSMLLGMASGLFPALLITSIKATDGLKGKSSNKGTNPVFRKWLLTFQFAASILMIVGTVVIWKQITFMKNQNLNFDDSQVLVVPLSEQDFPDIEKAMQRVKVMQEALATEPGVEVVTRAQNVPGRYWQNYNRFSDKADPTVVHSLRQSYVGADYFPALGVSFVEGRNFDATRAGDTAAVIINKKAMQAFGWQNIEDKTLCEGGQNGCTLYKVIGVTEDFHYQSLAGEVQPLIHFLDNVYGSLIVVRFQPGKTSSVLARVEKEWNGLESLSSFDYFFLDQEFAGMYREQERIGISAAFFSILAIVIASLGLFSVASFLIRRKRKEIGIRKVMGASLSELSVSLMKGYLLLVLVAFTIATPASYYLMSEFLQGFAYHIALDPTIFVIAGGLVLLFAMISVGLIVLRAAKENPVLALRDE
ncbi:MAG: ABC transporter permease [Imperialibacter sp.]|uniref:ABC transporter permease n=1 Tax=Imperialibacter sp. TaxID=2038411 RepID=UPI0032ED46B9